MHLLKSESHTGKVFFQGMEKRVNAEALGLF